MEMAPSEQVVDSRRDLAQVLATGGLALLFGLASFGIFSGEADALGLGIALLLLQAILAGASMTLAFRRRSRLGPWGIPLGIFFGVVGLAGLGYLGLLAMIFSAGARVGG